MPFVSKLCVLCDEKNLTKRTQRISQRSRSRCLDGANTQNAKLTSYLCIDNLVFQRLQNVSTYQTG